MPNISNFNQQVIDPIEVTILNGLAESSIANLQGTTAARIYFPAAFTGTAVTFESSFDGVNFFQVIDALGVPISVNSTVSSSVGLSPQTFYGIRFLKLVSDANEAADRLITLVPYSV